jgi:hypothetical protein
LSFWRIDLPNYKRFLPLSWNGFAFEPFQVSEFGVPLDELSLPPDLELIVFSRNGMRRALIAREMAYHHVAQGELGGEPYLVSF